MHEQVQGNPYQGTADPAASGRMPPTSTGMEVTAVGPDVVTTEPSFVADGRIGGSVAAGPMRVAPRAVGIGGGTLMMLLGAAGVGWYLIRRRREEQKPVNRLRRRLRVLQHDLEERMPEPTVEAAGPAGGATLALLLAGLLLRAFRQSRSRDAAADTSGSVQKVVAGAPMPPAAMETLQSGWRKISPIVRGAGETTRSRAKDLANVAGSAGDRVSGSRAQAGVGTGAVLAAAAAGYLAWRFLRRDEKASSYLNWDEGSINARRAPNQ